MYGTPMAPASIFLVKMTPDGEQELVAPLATLAPSIDYRTVHQLAQQDTDVGNRPSNGDSQRMALCGESGLLAVANGRVIDLYQATNTKRLSAPLHDPTGPIDVSSNHPDNAQVHLPFAAQIVLEDHIDAANGESHMAVTATCVLFAAPGYLLVAATTAVSLINRESAIHSSTWLCGFRTYARSVGVSTQSVVSSPLFVHCSFADRLPACNQIQAMALNPSQATQPRESGAALVQFNEGEEFGVFRWSERFSNRELSLARPTPTSPPVTSLTVTAGGRWVALCDAGGTLSVLDFRVFAWDLSYGTVDTSTTGHGKRLSLGPSYRLGREVHGDQPLHPVRLEERVLISGNKARGTALRWWTREDASGSLRAARYLIVGQSDGTLAIMRLTKSNDTGDERHRLSTEQVYPAMRSLKNDPIVFISEPELSTDATHARFTVVSTTARRRWAVRISHDARSGKGCRLEWPTLVESLSVPTTQILQQPLGGWAPLTQRDRLGRSLHALLSSECSQTSWIVLLAGSTISMSTWIDGPGEPHEEPSIDHIGKAAVLPLPQKQATTTTEEDAGAAVVPTTTHVAQKHHGKEGPHSVQDRYKLPERRSLPTHAKIEVGQHHSKLTKDECNKRLTAMARRVDRLGTNLHTLRHSFKLFTEDVQGHLLVISEQLESIPASEAPTTPQ